MQSVVAYGIIHEKEIAIVALQPRKEPMIDGHAGFLFLDKNDMPMVALNTYTHVGFDDAKQELLRVAGI